MRRLLRKTKRMIVHRVLDVGSSPILLHLVDAITTRRAERWRRQDVKESQEEDTCERD